MPFAKGQSGNPAGRPSKKGESLRSEIVTLLSESVEGEEIRLSAIIRKLVSMADAGNLKAVEILFSYAYGKPGAMPGDAPDNEIIIRIIDADSDEPKDSV